jgi:ribosomal protein S18 acetylase RimI-like enzyme
VPVELHPMSDVERDAYLRRSRIDYVNDLVASGMSAAAAATRADEQQRQALPDARPTHGHQVRAVIERERTIGHVWYGPEPDASDDRWWLWDIWVNESDRGRGVGREVLALVEAEVRRLHGTSLGLSVFGSNDRARQLYERAGFEVVSVRDAQAGVERHSNVDMARRCGAFRRCSGRWFGLVRAPPVYALSSARSASWRRTVSIGRSRGRRTSVCNVSPERAHRGCDIEDLAGLTFGHLPEHVDGAADPEPA